jgi:hypothetical protein
VILRDGDLVVDNLDVKIVEVDDEPHRAGPTLLVTQTAHQPHPASKFSEFGNNSILRHFAGHIHECLPVLTLHQFCRVTCLALNPYLPSSPRSLWVNSLPLLPTYRLSLQNL